MVSDAMPILGWMGQFDFWAAIPDFLGSQINMTERMQRGKKLE